MGKTTEVKNSGKSSGKTSDKSNKKEKKVNLNKEDAKHLKENVKATKSTKSTKETNGKGTKGKNSTKGPNKESRYAHIDRGDKPNKETAWAGCTFNVKSTKKYLKSYLEQTHDTAVPMINLHFAATAVTELFMQILVEQATKFSKKEKKKADCYNISLDDVKRAVRENNELRTYLGSEVEGFSPKSMNYTATFIESRDNVLSFIDTKMGTSQVSFDNDALNLIVYLTLYNLNRHVDLANSHRSYAKKSSIDFRSLVFSNRVLLGGEYQKKCQIKLDELEAMLSGKKTDESSEGSKDESDDEGSDDEGSGDEASDDEESDDSENESDDE